LDCGAFAVGIDLEPGERNPYVVNGDFNRTVFPDRSVDCVFTNSLDHAFDLDMVLREVARVIKSSGRFVLELALGLAEVQKADLQEKPTARDFESCFWQTRACVTDMVKKLGFDERFAMDISVPYAGTHYVFARASSA
jgi:ubiquinone/menaquinone biosynthesis C-methylase UbiE